MQQAGAKRCQRRLPLFPGVSCWHTLRSTLCRAQRLLLLVNGGFGARLSGSRERKRPVVESDARQMLDSAL
jgi:hypothetical protein